MFKIKIEDLSVYKDSKKNPYQIRYETVPDLSKGSANVIYHEVRFSSVKAAQKVAADMSVYFGECYFLLDLIYTKLKQLELRVKDLPKYLKIDFNAIEGSRAKLLKASQNSDYAYNHINAIKSFLNGLKYWCFAVCKDFEATANELFKMLLDFEIHFINTYRSSKMLSQSKQMKMFL